MCTSQFDILSIEYGLVHSKYVKLLCMVNRASTWRTCENKDGSGFFNVNDVDKEKRKTSCGTCVVKFAASLFILAHTYTLYLELRVTTIFHLQCCASSYYWSQVPGSGKKCACLSLVLFFHFLHDKDSPL